jgi:hypothetical protein
MSSESSQHGDVPHSSIGPDNCSRTEGVIAQLGPKSHVRVPNIESLGLFMRDEDYQLENETDAEFAARQDYRLLNF